MRVEDQNVMGVTSTLRLRNIHDKIGGKSEGEEFIDAEASDNNRAE
jgi:hypothetical protein